MTLWKYDITPRMHTQFFSQGGKYWKYKPHYSFIFFYGKYAVSQEKMENYGWRNASKQMTENIYWKKNKQSDQKKISSLRNQNKLIIYLSQDGSSPWAKNLPRGSMNTQAVCFCIRVCQCFWTI